MRIRDIVSMPTHRNVGVQKHWVLDESSFRAWHILEEVKRLLELRTPSQVVLEYIQELQDWDIEESSDSVVGERNAKMVLMHPNEIAELLSISVRGVYRMMEKGRLSSYRLTKRVVDEIRARAKQVEGEELTSSPDDQDATRGKLISLAEACKRFSISKSTLDGNIRRGNIRAYGSRPRKVKEDDIARVAPSIKKRARKPVKEKKRAKRTEKRKKAEKLRIGPLTAEENRKRLEELRRKERGEAGEYPEPPAEGL